eukprot:g70324.t1
MIRRTLALRSALDHVNKGVLGMGDAVAVRPKRSTLADKLMVKPGHRQAPCGLVATVFGCTGFVGPYTVQTYGYFGCQVITPYRGDSKKARILKPMGDLGMIVPIPFSFYDEESVRRCVSDINITKQTIIH